MATCMATKGYRATTISDIAAAEHPHEVRPVSRELLVAAVGGATS